MEDSVADGGWLSEYRLRAGRATGAGLVAVIVGALLVPASEAIGSSIVIVGLMGLGLGVAGLVRTLRIERLVAREGWRRRQARFRVVGGGNGQPGLVLLAAGAEPEAVLTVATTVFRWGALNGHDVLWLTGDPQSRFAAVATPALDVAIVVKRPVVARWRTRIRRIALSQ